MTQRKKGLLEWLVEQSGLCYVSDLRGGIRTPHISSALCAALKKVPLDCWPVVEWEEAVAYLLDERRDFSCAQEAADYLLHSF